MSVFRRHRWPMAAAALTAVYAVVSLTASRGYGLTIFADVAGLSLMALPAGVMFLNARRAPAGIERRFWQLMAVGFSFWAFNQAVWGYYEVLLHQELPDPCSADIVLFFHLVPMIAAVAWRPDRLKNDQRRLGPLNFLMLLVWWIFLYAFIVFPHQYVVLNPAIYNRYYDVLYMLENILLLATLAIATLTSTGAWRRLYGNFLLAGLCYTVSSQLLDRAVINGTYYSGSFYDVPLIGAVAWMATTALRSRAWDLQPSEAAEPSAESKAKKLIPQLTMLAMLSLPALGLWTYLIDNSPAPSRQFRLFAVIAAMIALGVFVFLRQYIQDQTLIALLEKSRNSYDSQRRLQNHLVQKEKLASLGQIVAGAAHEINHPLTAIMACSEQLWSNERLEPEQDQLVRKIVMQAQRTRDLVSDLLSFAQQAPGEKALVDLSVLLHRSAQMLESQHHSSRIRVEIFIEPEFPRVRGNANQLFQAFVEMIENAMDALEESGGGSLRITAQIQNQEAVLQFADSGPGIREPERVFDPFYTTKPVGKGTGLGLSAVYGVMQDHNAQITCQNRPEGGAVFTVRFPALAEPAPQAEAAKA